MKLITSSEQLEFKENCLKFFEPILPVLLGAVRINASRSHALELTSDRVSVYLIRDSGELSLVTSVQLLSVSSGILEHASRNTLRYYEKILSQYVLDNITES